MCFGEPKQVLQWHRFLLKPLFSRVNV